MPLSYSVTHKGDKPFRQLNILAHSYKKEKKKLIKKFKKQGKLYQMDHSSDRYLLVCWKETNLELIQIGAWTYFVIVDGKSENNLLLICST